MQNENAAAELSPIKRAYLAVEKAQAKVREIEGRYSVPIAIVGIGCRIPGAAHSPDEFWQLLCEGRHAITEVPADRWDIDLFYDPDPDAPAKMVARHGGFLQDIDQFDPDFFGISPREAALIDPQQRLLLESTWEALEHGGLDASALYGSRTGVFLGYCNSDYTQRMQTHRVEMQAHLGTGNAASVAAGRISYQFGLKGPSVAVDSACSSSLVAVHLACQSLRQQECDLALGCGVNLILWPLASLIFSKSRMLARDGRCKTFDALADGYVRGEGVGVVALKRLPDALADGDPIVAVIRGSAVNQDGPSGGLTVPNGPSQQDVIRSALANGNVDPADVTYLEAHGTGTSLGDPIEVGALGAVFAASRSKQDPLLIGSVKTNIGHLEAAAGIAGLIKLALILQRGEIPAHLHFQTPNPHIAWDDLPIQVTTRRQRWPTDRPRVGGVSSFGFSGTNAHVVLAAPPQLAASGADRSPSHEASTAPPQESGPQLITLSAKSQKALQQLAAQHASRLAASSLRLCDVAHTLSRGRAHLHERLALVASSVDEVAEKLAEFQAHGQAAGVIRGRASQPPEKVAFLFSGEGSQRVGVGRQLALSQPAFRESLQRCQEMLAEMLDLPLLDVLVPPATGRSPIDQAAYAQPALFALEYSLAQLWQSWGIRPAALWGQGIGHFVAATWAGVFSLEDALRLVVHRGRLMQELPPDDEMLSQFRSVAETVEYATPSLPLIGSMTGRQADSEVADAEYWCQDFSKDDRVAQSITTLSEMGVRHFVEIGPDSTLLQVARGGVSDDAQENEHAWVPSLGQGRDDLEAMLTGLGQLYVRGEQPMWQRVMTSGESRRISLPTYAFQRERCWLDVPSFGNVFASDSVEHPLLGSRILSAAEPVQFQAELRAETPSFLQDHRLGQLPVLPASAYIEVALAAASRVFADEALGKLLVLKKLSLEQVLLLPPGQPCTVQTIVTPEGDDYRLQFHSLAAPDGKPTWQCHASAELVLVNSSDPPATRDLASLQRDCSESIDVSTFYQVFSDRGIDYGPQHRGVQQLWRGSHAALAKVTLPQEAKEATGYYLHPALLDACLQPLAGLVGERNTAYLPTGLERWTQFDRLPSEIWSHVRLQSGTGERLIVADVELLTKDGHVAAALQGLCLQPLVGDVEKMISRWEDKLTAHGESSRRADGSSRAVSPEGAKVAASLKVADPDQRRPLVVEFLQSEVAGVLRKSTEQRVDPHRLFLELGMDSLTGLDLIYRIRSGLHVELPAKTLWQHPTIDELADAILRQLDGELGPSVSDRDLPERGQTLSDKGPDTFLKPALASAAPIGVAQSDATPWLIRWPRTTEASVRLFCFHGLGGAASTYSEWVEHLPSAIEVFAIQLPGREQHVSEPWVDFQAVLDHLLDVVLDHLDRPFAFFGNSAGNLLSYELAHLIRQRLGLIPEWLFVGALWAPEVVAEAASDHGDQLKALLQPLESQQQPSERTKLALVEQTAVAADLDLFTGYRYQPKPPLDCPILAIAADEDPLIHREDLEAWAPHTSEEFRIEMVSGTHHSYIMRYDQLLPQLARALLD